MDAFNEPELTELFSLPLSQVAYDQVLNIQQKMENAVITEAVNDVWSYSRGAPRFKSAVAYRKLLGHQYVDHAFRWLWKSSCQPKHKVFFWLLLKDRLSTRNILRRKQMTLKTYNCEICLMMAEETVEHLFWHCPFAQQCWRLLGLKDQMQSQFFMVAVVLMSWTIWKARNEMIFNNNQLSIQECRDYFFKEVKLVSLRVKPSLLETYNQWIQHI